MPRQRRVLAHLNRRALTVHLAGANTPRTSAVPTGGQLSWPTRPPLLRTRPGTASNNGRTARGRPQTSSPLQPPTPARRRSGPGARQRPSAGATLPPHSPPSPRSTPSPTCTPRSTNSPRFVASVARRGYALLPLAARGPCYHFAAQFAAGRPCARQAPVERPSDE